jgi:hypothetical protein
MNLAQIIRACVKEIFRVRSFRAMFCLKFVNSNPSICELIMHWLFGEAGRMTYVGNRRGRLSVPMMY